MGGLQVLAVAYTQFSQGMQMTLPFTIAVYMVRNFETGEHLSEQRVSRLTGLLAAVYSSSQVRRTALRSQNMDVCVYQSVHPSLCYLAAHPELICSSILPCEQGSSCLTADCWLLWYILVYKQNPLPLPLRIFAFDGNMCC